MNLSARILRIIGWDVEIVKPGYPKCIICVVPHTSNWDFILGELAFLSVGGKAKFLMKEAWFRWPLGYFFRAIGGIPVPKKRGAALTDAIVEMFNKSDKLVLAITPEGTRKPTAKWRSGFLHIARQANVPILLGSIDYKYKYIAVTHEFKPTGDVEADMRYIKEYYKNSYALYPEKFIIYDEQESQSSGDSARHRVD